MARELHNDGAQGAPPSAASLESARQAAESAMENFRYQKTDDEPPAEEVCAVPGVALLEGLPPRPAFT